MEKNLNMHYRYMEHRIRPGSRRDFSVFAYKSRNILDILSSPDMHYLRAPFALLATTFVIDVLATPMNVPIRRDGPLDVNFIIVDLAVVSLAYTSIVLHTHELNSSFPPSFSFRISNFSKTMSIVFLQALINRKRM